MFAGRTSVIATAPTGPDTQTTRPELFLMAAEMADALVTVTLQPAGGVGVAVGTGVGVAVGTGVGVAVGTGVGVAVGTGVGVAVGTGVGVAVGTGVGVAV